MFCTILCWNFFATPRLLGQLKMWGTYAKGQPLFLVLLLLITDLVWKWVQYEIHAECVFCFSSFWRNTGTVCTVDVWKLSTCKGTKSGLCWSLFWVTAFNWGTIIPFQQSRVLWRATPFILSHCPSTVLLFSACLQYSLWCVESDRM